MDNGRIVVFDTTLRDGEQAPGFSLRLHEKLAMARHLDDLGVDVIEAGFPIASSDDAEAVRFIATAIRRPIVAALARACRDDIERAAWALAPADRPRIHTFIATSDLHLTRKLRMTREQCFEAAVSAVRLARMANVANAHIPRQARTTRKMLRMRSRWPARTTSVISTMVAVAAMSGVSA